MKSVWNIQLTLPPEPKKPGSSFTYSKNLSVVAIAETFDGAMALVKNMWPDAKIWSVNHVANRTVLFEGTQPEVA